MDTAVGLVKAYLELCCYFVLAELAVRAAERGAYHDVTDLDIVACASRIRRWHCPDASRDRRRSSWAPILPWRPLMPASM